MEDLRSGAGINDGSVEPPDVNCHSVPLDASHVSGPTCRVVPVHGGLCETFRVNPLKADLVPIQPTSHCDKSNPLQEPDPPLELLEEDAVAKSKRHATIHVAITRMAAHPRKILADLCCIRIILRPKLFGLFLVGHEKPVVRTPFSGFNRGLLVMPDQQGNA